MLSTDRLLRAIETCCDDDLEAYEALMATVDLAAYDHVDQLRIRDALEKRIEEDEWERRKAVQILTRHGLLPDESK